MLSRHEVILTIVRITSKRSTEHLQQAPYRHCPLTLTCTISASDVRLQFLIRESGPKNETRLEAASGEAAFLLYLVKAGTMTSNMPTNSANSVPGPDWDPHFHSSSFRRATFVHGLLQAQQDTHSMTSN